MCLRVQDFRVSKNAGSTCKHTARGAGPKAEGARGKDKAQGHKARAKNGGFIGAAVNRAP